MSVEYEHIFSSIKYLITHTCSQLLPDIIEANECLKHWFGKLEEEDEPQEEEIVAPDDSDDEEGNSSRIQTVNGEVVLMDL